MLRFATPLFLAASVFALSACQPEAGSESASDAAAEAAPANLAGAENAAPAAQAGADAWLAGVDLAAYLDCARENGATFLQAHRAGDRPGAAENSLRAIEASLADGAVFAEMDVFRTADGALVLMHDRTVDRTTTGTGNIAEMTYAEVSALELVDVDGAPTGERVPSFEAALAYLDGRGIAQVDLKNPEFEEIAAALEAADAVDRSVVITYSMDDALALHERLPAVMISVGINDLADLAALREAGADLSRFTAWLGVGTGNPDLDALLADAGLETSYGDFGGERDGSVDYALLASNGAEVISVDDVPAAAAALNARETARSVLDGCEAARP
ncbi:glycerophosphodiester phosphodiesterase family protein [Maricaulaceae bacterium MS644]